MTGYLLRRTGQALVVVVFVTMIVFGLEHLLPGGPARAILGVHATPSNIAAFNKQNGLDRPLPQQYWTWLTQVLQGNFGFSYVLNESVRSLLAQRLPKTAFLAGASVLLALLVAVPIGLLQAARRNRPDDVAVTTVVFALYSTPAFWLALLLIEFLAVRNHLFPAEAPQGNFDAVFSDFRAMVLPILTIALVIIAAFTRYIRASALDQLTMDYVRMARSKGAGQTRILYGHILRNAISPVVTLLGVYLPFILSGTLIAEEVFNYPGVGLLFFNAATTQDYPTLLGVILVVAVASVVGSLLADIAYAVLDPRVRYTGGRSPAR
ncbi:MAG TPA: ABC transporter permease [Acidimicrobiales bacterium]|nr:ABC transporter permease [Acidimicrobiales bacterium]